MNNSPPFKRHSVGRTYPWQVAPQQSLLPFRFNNTKFKSVNYIYNLSKFPATFTFPSYDIKVIRTTGEIIIFTKLLICRNSLIASVIPSSIRLLNTTPMKYSMTSTAQNSKKYLWPTDKQKTGPVRNAK